jgi:hypothetical protein
MKFTKMEVNDELRNLNPGKSYGEQERNVNVEWEQSNREAEFSLEFGELKANCLFFSQGLRIILVNKSQVKQFFLQSLLVLIEVYLGSEHVLEQKVGINLLL